MQFSQQALLFLVPIQGEASANGGWPQTQKIYDCRSRCAHHSLFLQFRSCGLQLHDSEPFHVDVDVQHLSYAARALNGLLSANFVNWSDRGHHVTPVRHTGQPLGSRQNDQRGYLHRYRVPGHKELLHI